MCAPKEEVLHKLKGLLLTRIFLVLVLFVIAALIIADSHVLEEAENDVNEEVSEDVEEDVSSEEDATSEEEVVIDPTSFEAGKIIADESCSGCHGLDGNTSSPAYGNLAGQNALYLYEQMKLIKSHDRFISLMAKTFGEMGEDGVLIDPMPDDSLRALATYYSLLPGRIGQADPGKDLELGKKIYKGGILEKEVAACSACHGPFGNGNLLAGFPRVSGQTVQYLEAQLTAYREEERTTDEKYGGMMRDIAKKLTDGEISAVANYMTGLYNAP